MNPASYNPLKDTHFWFRVGDEGVDAVPHRCVSSPRYMQAMAVLEEGGTEAEATEAAIDAADVSGALASVLTSASMMH